MISFFSSSHPDSDRIMETYTSMSSFYFFSSLSSLHEKCCFSTAEGRPWIWRVWRKGHSGPVWEERDLNISKKKKKEKRQKKEGCDMDPLYTGLINVSQAPSLPAA